MKIENIKIQNFKGIKNYDGKIDGKNVYLVGGNGKGKTSFLDAVWYGLKGKLKIPEITHNGAKKGLIEIDLGDFIARTKLKKGRRAEFELENKVYSNETERFVKSPRSYLESRIGMISFDIKEFFGKTGLEQVKYFSKIMGVDFSDLDAEIEELEESRRFDKRDLAKAKLNQNYFDEEEAAKDYISVLELTKSIDQEVKKRADVLRVKKGMRSAKKEISELKARIAGLEEKIGLGHEWLADYEPHIIKSKEINEKKKTRNNAELINEQIKEAKEAKQADELVEQYEKNIQECTDGIEEYRKKKAARISENLNVEGLVYDIDKECFLYNGLPFDQNQTNTASQLITGMKIGATLLQDLKILKVDASLIDEVEFNKVLEWADKEGIELFVELVDRKATQLKIQVGENE